MPLRVAAAAYVAFLKHSGNDFWFFHPNTPGKTIVGGASYSTAGDLKPGWYSPGEPDLSEAP
eukprot:2155501-Heterocapsa_arctica.AAC.1